MSDYVPESLPQPDEERRLTIFDEWRITIYGEYAERRCHAIARHFALQESMYTLDFDRVDRSWSITLRHGVVVDERRWQSALADSEAWIAPPLTLPPDLAARLDVVATAKGRTMDELVIGWLTRQVEIAEAGTKIREAAARAREGR